MVQPSYPRDRGEANNLVFLLLLWQIHLSSALQKLAAVLAVFLVKRQKGHKVGITFSELEAVLVNMKFQLVI